LPKYFALFSKVFICFVCNFTWSSKIDMKFFSILFTNLWKRLDKILFSCQSGSKNIFGKTKLHFDLRKVSFFHDYFQRLVNKIQNICVSTIVLHLNLQQQQVKTLEMRTKSIWQVTFHCFTPILLPPELFDPKTHEFKHSSRHPQTFLMYSMLLKTRDLMKETDPI
jgi:hypothetical protein